MDGYVIAKTRIALAVRAVLCSARQKSRPITTSVARLWVPRVIVTANAGINFSEGEVFHGSLLCGTRRGLL